ncbi:hypothetical protein ACLOJK_032490 [Asimina triloba]
MMCVRINEHMLRMGVGLPIEFDITKILNAFIMASIQLVPNTLKILRAKPIDEYQSLVGHNNTKLVEHANQLTKEAWSNYPSKLWLKGARGYLPVPHQLLRGEILAVVLDKGQPILATVLVGTTSGALIPIGLVVGKKKRVEGAPFEEEQLKSKRRRWLVKVTKDERRTRRRMCGRDQSHIIDDVARGVEELLSYSAPHGGSSYPISFGDRRCLGVVLSGSMLAKLGSTKVKIRPMDAETIEPLMKEDIEHAFKMRVIPDPRSEDGGAPECERHEASEEMLKDHLLDQ